MWTALSGRAAVWHYCLTDAVAECDPSHLKAPDRPQDGPLRIVAIGGGTGLSTLLNGLKSYVPWVDITAVVTVTDDGGSSGRLRRDFDVLPPGDIRNCMVALCEDEGLLSKLFQYRFETGRGLRGHSFGNLFLTALTALTGDFPKAVQLSSEVLASRGRIFPSTDANVSLEAVLQNGDIVRGETRISKSRSGISRVRLSPLRCRPMPETLEAIATADLISFGPGSLYTSVIPNLLVHGIPAAIRASRASKVYFCNLMWQPGETMNYTASDHVAAIHAHAKVPVIDTVVLNSGPIAAPLRRRYAAQRAMPVEVDADKLVEMGLRVVLEDLVAKSERVRHDPRVAAAALVRLGAESQRRRSKSKRKQG